MYYLWIPSNTPFYNGYQHHRTCAVHNLREVPCTVSRCCHCCSRFDEHIRFCLTICWRAYGSRPPTIPQFHVGYRLVPCFSKVGQKNRFVSLLGEQQHFTETDQAPSLFCFPIPAGLNRSSIRFSDRTAGWNCNAVLESREYCTYVTIACTVSWCQMRIWSNVPKMPI